MIKQLSDGDRYICLESLGDNAEFPINRIMESLIVREEVISDKFSYEDIEASDANASINFSQYENKLVICVYGPREGKYRDKMKNDRAVLDIYSKFNTEINKEKNKKINATIQNFCESLIFLEEYPRCQIHIAINVLSYLNETKLLASIFNGLMLALSISGLDLKTFALTSCFVDDEKNVIISLDANKKENIILIESNIPLTYNDYEEYINKSQTHVEKMHKRFQKILIEKLNLK